MLDAFIFLTRANLIPVRKIPVGSCRPCRAPPRSACSPCSQVSADEILRACPYLLVYGYLYTCTPGRALYRACNPDRQQLLAQWLGTPAGGLHVLQARVQVVLRGKSSRSSRSARRALFDANFRGAHGSVQRKNHAVIRFRKTIMGAPPEVPILHYC